MSAQFTRRAFLRESALLAAGAGFALTGGGAEAAPDGKRAIVWSEGTAPNDVYPHDINFVIAEGLKPLGGWNTQTVSINDPEQGLPQSTLQAASVLIWWGHMRHGEVQDELVERIVTRVTEEGMGFIGTHSAHWSKPFKALMKTSASWNGGYVEDGSKLNITVSMPRHPIAKGLKNFVIPHTERYTEPFDVPTPETLVFDGLYTRPNGATEPSRQGMTWTVGKGRVFYFQPGHESYPIYYQAEVQKVFRNAVQWVAAKR